MIYIYIYITHIEKICDLVGQKFKFLCKRIGCRAQEGAQQTISDTNIGRSWLKCKSTYSWKQD